MNRDPILASRTFPAGHDGYNVPLIMRVGGGLDYLKGNSKPYFSLTYTQHRKGFPNQCYSGGAGHEYILKYFPRFADLAALHLSDIDGIPTHAEANGWYDLAGALGGMGEQYHVGNSERHFPIVPDPATPWKNTEYRKPTQAECLQIFADHCRVSVEEARAIVDDVLDSDPGSFVQLKDRAKCIRARWAEVCETMRPRWKAEAEACIKKHNLKVFGDAWESAA